MEKNSSEETNQKKEEPETRVPKTELRQYEQYFFTEKVLIDIVENLQYNENILCVCAPTVADAFWRYKQREIYCLDLDERFNYLPLYRKCDITDLSNIPLPENFVPDLIIFDPPFFGVKLIQMHDFFDKITKGNKNIKIAFGFLIRDEQNLLYIFNDYGLQRNKYQPEYRYVEPERWRNYGLYTNFESGKFKYMYKKNKKK